MELLVLDKEFNTVRIIDEFESMIWTDRYDECGEFELKMPAFENFSDVFKMDYFIYWSERKDLMIIEKIETDKDSEEGDSLYIAGRNLASILDRRIIWIEITYPGDDEGEAQTKTTEVIEAIIDQNLINPKPHSDYDKEHGYYKNRKIKNFKWLDPDVDKDYDDKVIVEYWGENVLESVQELCQNAYIGFRTTFDGTNFNFQLYNGEDRTWEQKTNPYVVFSESYDNISDTQFVENREDYRNIILVSGEDDWDWAGKHRTKVSGMKRREIFYESSSSKAYTDSDGNEQEMSDDDYYALLQKEGMEELKDYQKIKGFDCEFDLTNTQFVFEQDYFIGDIVQVKDRYGNEDRVRLTEVTFSQDGDGFKMTPTFRSVTYDEDEEED